MKKVITEITINDKGDSSVDFWDPPMSKKQLAAIKKAVLIFELIITAAIGMSIIAEQAIELKVLFVLAVGSRMTLKIILIDNEK